MKLIPMNPAEFEVFAQRSVAGYARDIARTYTLHDAVACESARAEFDEVLTHGLDTDGHWFYRLCVGADLEVGSLWMGTVEAPPLPARLFIYDLEIHEPFRRQGLGRQALEVVEAWALNRGIRRLELNVFSDNVAARRLYETSGMAPREITLSKAI